MAQNAKYVEEMSCFIAYWEQIYDEVTNSIPSILMIFRRDFGQPWTCKGTWQEILLQI